MSRIGLLGGSFNPAHLGHRRISLAAMRRFDLDELWWLVSPGNPLKDEKGMAPLAARVRSAKRVARRSPIRVSFLERDLGTRYTIDTLHRLRILHPHHRFLWLMGNDNLAQFHRWREWRRIARTVPIAVIARPGYDDMALRGPAMGWLRRFVRPAADAKNWTRWRLPSIVLLRLPPDPTSATAIRAAFPQWHENETKSFKPLAVRDGVTRKPLSGRRPFACHRTRPSA